MKAFEYLRLIDPSEEDLNEYGSQGWELVSVLSDYNGISYFLKREKGVEPVAIPEQTKPTDPIERAMEEAIKEWPGAKLAQVKYIKETLNTGLKEAKDIVDDYWDTHPFNC